MCMNFIQTQQMQQIRKKQNVLETSNTVENVAFFKYQYYFSDVFGWKMLQS